MLIRRGRGGGMTKSVPLFWWVLLLFALSWYRKYEGLVPLLLMVDNDNNKECLRLHQDYFDESEWQEAIRRNEYFHDQGGSLKSVQQIMDSSIDSTVESLDLTFLVPNVISNNKRNIERVSVDKPVTQWLHDYYSQNYDPRGGYGKPLPGKWSNENSKALSEKRWFDVIEPPRGRQRWDAGLGPIGPKCQNLLQLGDTTGDGYKFYCRPLHEKNNNNSQSAIAPQKYHNDCHVLSVGGNDNWKFEKAVVQQLGCITHTFDCTLPGGKPRRKPNNPNIRFYNYCVHGKTHTDNHGHSYLTYADMLKTAGIQKAPSYFKIDVEGFEYDIFQQMILQSRDLLPAQIQVELHWGTRMTGLPWMLRRRTAGEIALFSSMMFHGGYLPIHLDFNAYCSSCMEVLYFRAPPC